jgi:hypothetical protein
LIPKTPFNGRFNRINKPGLFVESTKTKINRAPVEGQEEICKRFHNDVVAPHLGLMRKRWYVQWQHNAVVTYDWLTNESREKI